MVRLQLIGHEGLPLSLLIRLSEGYVNTLLQRHLNPTAYPYVV